MKLIKKGQDPKTRIWHGICSRCKSEFEATESEMTHIDSCQREGTWSWEKCPECGAGGAPSGYGGVLFTPSKEKLQNPKDTQPIATAPTLLKQHKWNRTCRDAADKLLAEAGFDEDSSIRNALSSMNFDGIEQATK